MTSDPAGWAKVLLVAHDPARLDRLLRSAGYHDIHGTADLDAVPTLVATLQPDLLVLNVRRPARGALRLIETLRRQRPARIYLPILILAARATPATRRRMLAAGANDVLTRPVDRLEFLLRARNLLESRRLHRALQTEKASIDRLQNAALEAAADAIVITDRDGTIRWVNRAFSALTGYAAAEVVGQRPRLLRSGQHPPEFYAHLWRTIVSGAVWRGEVVNRYKDGRLATEAMTITPVRDDEGAITHFIAIKQDVTEARETARTQARLSAILEASPDFVATADPQGRVLYRNQAARRQSCRTISTRPPSRSPTAIHPGPPPACSRRAFRRPCATACGRGKRRC
jgi:PAS domain S-box-containing protein